MICIYLIVFSNNVIIIMYVIIKFNPLEDLAIYMYMYVCVGSGSAI